MGPVLVVVGGLPATGKSTVAAALARRIRAPYLRVDRIEHAVVSWTALTQPLGPVGYAVAHGLAADQLGLGLDVVVECVNPSAITRDAWVATAEGARSAIAEVELVCSDPVEHRRRATTRRSDVDGLVKPTWSEIGARDHEPWERPHLVLDTATTVVETAVDRLTELVAQLRR